MRRSSIIMLAAAIALGLIAVFLARFVLAPEAREVAVDAGVVTLSAVVASQPIAFGEKLTADKLKVVRWPSEGLPQGSFQRISDATAEEAVALRPIQPNELITTAALSGRDGRLSASKLLSPNMRAVAVPLSESTGVAGFIVAGDRVDVYLTRDPGGEQMPYSDLLVQGARVLAVGQDSNIGKEKPEVVRTATIEVTPQQAHKVALAQTIGTLSLSLRNLRDESRVAMDTVQILDLNDGTVTRILNKPRPEAQQQQSPTAPMTPKGPEVEVFRRGGQGTKQTVIG